MAADIKTNLLIGTLGLAVLAVGGYGLYQEVRRPNPAPATSRAESAPAREGAGRIEAPRQVSADLPDRVARYIGPAATRLEWSITGGALQSDNFSESVRWTAGSSGVVVLSCRAFDASGGSSLATAIVSVLPTPAITGFQPTPPAIPQGGSARLGWTAKDFNRLVLDPGGRDVSTLQGPGFEVKPTETTEYTLTATDALGKAVILKTTLTVVPPPTIESFRVEPKAGVPDAFTVIGAFKGAKAELKDGNGVLASSTATPLQFDLSGAKAGSSLSLVVSNEVGTTATSTVQFAAPKP